MVTDVFVYARDCSDKEMVVQVNKSLPRETTSHAGVYVFV